jgi:hypothetical protein
VSEVLNVIADLQKRGLLGDQRQRMGDNAQFDCPFHSPGRRQRTPSFGIRLAWAPGKVEGQWHCFSCHQGGRDIWTLWSKLTGETVETAKAELSATEVLIETVAQAVVSLDADIAAKTECLTDWPRTEPLPPLAQDYLRSRNIPEAMWAELGLEWFGGATMPPRRDKEESSVRGNRLIIPLDWDGRRIGYSSRAVGYDTDLRYYRPVLNLNTVFYDPRHLVASGYRGRVWVVEGEVDEWASLREGLPVMSSLGSALTRKQADILTGFKEVCFFYDGDKAGLEGVKRVAELFGGRLKWRAFWPPQGQDPASMTPGWGAGLQALADGPAPDLSLTSLEKALKGVRV